VYSLVEAGVIVAGCGRTEAKLKQMEQQIGTDKFRGYTCDLRDETAIVDMIKSVWNDFGTIQILVNNAGLGRESSLI
jgi:NADP-dependent 3-hydroxy acid dehydrogenase YdfG